MWAVEDEIATHCFRSVRNDQEKEVGIDEKSFWFIVCGFWWKEKKEWRNNWGIKKNKDVGISEIRKKKEFLIANKKTKIKMH